MDGYGYGFEMDILSVCESGKQSDFLYTRRGPTVIDDVGVDCAAPRESASSAQSGAVAQLQRERRSAS